MYYSILSGFPDLAERDNSAVGDGYRAVRDDGVHIDIHYHPEALAMRAVAFRRIERERMRGRLLEGDSRVRVHQMFRVMAENSGLHIQHRHGTLAPAQCDIHRIPDPFLIAGGRFELVHHELDEMGLVPVQGCHRGKIPEFPVNADLGEAAFAELVEEFLVMAFAASDERRQEDAFPPGIVPHYEADYLLVSVSDHFLSRDGGIGPGGPGIEKSQKIKYFRDGPDRGSGIVAGRFLFNGNDRAKAVDLLHVRLLQHAHEMLGVSGEGVHISSLPLGVYGIEGQ